MSEPDLQTSSEALPQAISPVNILKQAINKVPALKYSLVLQASPPPLRLSRR
jgi:hypothetical protein